MINERQSAILCAVVKYYIRQGEPVASRVLVNNFNIGVSPATVRADMAMLEEEGYLLQPHTSAGRIPSDLGYRFYVDQLLTTQKQSTWHHRQLLLEAGDLLGNVNDVLQKMSKQVADLLTCMTVITSPTVEDVYYSGVINLLGQPEFNDVNKIRNILALVEEKKHLIEVLNEQIRVKEAYMLRIGSEINAPELEDCSLLVSRYYYHDEPAGMVSLITVKRAEYEQLAPAFRALVSEFNSLLERID
jgi:transcriptional regulator of heat shock response